ncbi:unnamed protein product [Oikopleura dioica]|uniref:LIM zinc-binding domain-containing protein n=1 Tax=Oikopleura dioica TaxID=34765 RepID=E4WWI3_OIKDI|nr:unnamed protein product [Oikopleura dioica]
MEHRIPVVKVNTQKEALARAETRLNNLLSGLSEELNTAADNSNFRESEFGKCARCQQRIESLEEGCRALGEVFHNACFHCNRCGEQLVHKQFVHSNNRVYCDDCYSSQDALSHDPSCSSCLKPITDRICTASGKRFHISCFVCSICKCPLAGQEFRLGPGPEWELLCFRDWSLRYAPRCGGCTKPILPKSSSDKIDCYQIMNSASQQTPNSFYHFQCIN